MDILCNKPASAVSDLALLNQENDKILKTTNSAKVSCVPYVKIYSNSLFHVSAMKPTDYSSPIILDIDSGLMKAGFSSEDLPNTIFPTVIGQPKNKEINSCLMVNVYIGHEAQHTKAVLNLSQPCKHGIVTSWEDLEKIWCYTFYNQLQVDPGEHPVLLTDTIMSQCKDRKQMLQIMFEKFNVPYLYISLQAVLALYSTGRVTGTVFHSGDQVSYCVPVYETHRLQHAVQKFNLAGQDLTSYLAKLLKERDEFGLDVEEESVRDIKEKLCYVADNFHFEPPSQVLYNLPDGRTVTLGSERYRTCEALFSPQLLGKDQYGIHERVLKSLLLSDVDLRKQFAGNIVLSGGSTLFPGLTSRLQREISSMVPLDLLNTVNVSRVLDKDFAVWRGGATMANLQSFHTAWISRHDYNEFGPNIVHRRCF
ncbi:actin-3-like [Bombina bombina]|uniref:actin-3-like n=1 Tax=Bombina bombina TaxID=8345 RepID=UPI00235A7BC0|nr:actin-3-like [Bombina bombina]